MTPFFKLKSRPISGGYLSEEFATQRSSKNLLGRTSGGSANDRSQLEFAGKLLAALAKPSFAKEDTVDVLPSGKKSENCETVIRSDDLVAMG